MRNLQKILCICAKERAGIDVRKQNSEGYSDPTAYQALKNIEQEDERFHKLLHAIFDVCELANFEIEGRIVLVDKKTGKVWR